jgi:hypothetical protein
MTIVLGLLALFPVLTLAASWRRLTRSEVLRVLLLFALGLGAAWPFLTTQGLGAGDSANYSNSIADSVTQLRAGVLPVYVGQSDYAFNGRVHPLRTAPYFTYSTGLVDALAGHRLTFWELQNLLMAGSLVGAVFSAYLCLRRLGTVGPWTAALLAGIYLSAPSLLAAAYSLDLYMTVNTAPFLPIAMLGLVLTFDERTFSHISLLAIGLALCWLAHPPVAAWLSLGSAIVLLIGLVVHRPRWRDLLVIPAGILLLAILSAYGFVSSATIDPRLISAHYSRTAPAFVSSVMYMTKNFWRGSLLPVSKDGSSLSDFQLGYALWLLLLIAVGTAWRRRGGAVVGALGAMILFFLVAVTPVPWFHHTLWDYLPASVATMTNLWPMQRIYLLLSIAIIFLAALAWPRLPRPCPRAALWILPLALAAGGGWTGWEAWHFVRHGLSTRYSAEKTAATHRLENINLTVVAYAFLGYPNWFSYGTVDPEQSLHLLNPKDLSVMVSNASAGRGHLVAAGRLRIVRREENYRNYLEPRLRIEAGKEYRLRFRFLAPEFTGFLLLNGEQMARDYVLPHDLGAKGFGMSPGNNPEITLFTTSVQPEHVQLLITAAAADTPWTDFADFTLEEIDRSTLPLQIVRLVPDFECRFDAPQDCWLETPRMYMEGYIATVDGKPVQVASSLESMVMAAVPAGRHTLQLRYVGSPWLHRTFWLAVWGWVAVAAGLIVKAIPW